MLSNNYYNKLVDICCRVVSTDGEVTLEERIWMTNLKENNSHAEKVVNWIWNQMTFIVPEYTCKHPIFPHYNTVDLMYDAINNGCDQA